MSGMSERTRARARAGAVLAAALTVLAATLAGCQRRTNIVMIPADSTSAATIDSSQIAMRDAQQMWEAGNTDAAAAATARLLARDLAGREPGSWHDRASYLLDSLGVGGEFADAPCALMINFFSRSDPEGPSWPYLYWCGADAPGYQEVEGATLRLQALIARGLVRTGVGADSVRRVAAVFTRRAPGGSQPIVTTWATPPRGAEHWSVLQSLGPDSLGGSGTAGFEAVTDTGADLAVRTYRTPTGFVECATCAHAYTVSRFHWTAQGFVRDETRQVPSPYATFTAFITDLVAGNRAAAMEHVSDPTLVLTATRLEWNVRKGAWAPRRGRRSRRST